MNAAKYEGLEHSNSLSKIYFLNRYLKSYLSKKCFLYPCIFQQFFYILYCNEYGTIYTISSDFGDRMITQLMGVMVLLSEHF